jgi:hypothetical protein
MNIKRLHQVRFVLFFALAATLSLAQETSRTIPPAFGPHVRLIESDFAEAKSVSKSDRIVATYYFYWYDIATREHILDGDGSDALTTHPPTLEDFSYKSARWHRQQLEDMIAAGIDVVLPVFWGAPSEQNPKAGLHWSYAGLPPLVEARDELVREGKHPPRIGLFYDTSTLQYNQWGLHIDLTTDFGKRWFYATVRDFFSMIPARHWAMIEGKPMVLLYAAAFARNHDQGFVDYLRAEFPKEFAGRVPYLVRQDSWRIQADNTCAWGGALGLRNPGVASLGPGYDHSAVPGRTPLVADRRGGKFYEDNWLKFLRRPANIVTLETWNEFHEGTDICESKEFGRQYIELTRKYTDLFKQGWKPPWPKGKFSNASALSLVFQTPPAEDSGLRLVEHEDGLSEWAECEGRVCRSALPAPGKGTYIYFAVDDSFKTSDRMPLRLTVDYYDAAPGTLTVDFDGSDEKAPFNGAYTRCAETAKLNGSKTWQTARFDLPDARLLNSQNSGADFRLVIGSPKFFLRQVTLSRR